MAHIYVDSAAAGAGTGASWANAYTTLKAAAENAGTAAGDSIWVAHSHAETGAGSNTITFKNTSSAPGTVMCVNKAGSVPPVSADLRTTATVTRTGVAVLSIGGWFYIYGITFSATDGASNGSLAVAYGSSFQYFKNCQLKRPGTGGGNIIIGGGNAPAQAVLDNTTLTFGDVGDSLNVVGGNLTWKNTPSAIGGAVFPTTLITFSGDFGAGGFAIVEGVDLSALGSGKTIVGVLSGDGAVLVKNCKIHASVTLAATPTTSSRIGPTFVNCDSGDTNYKTAKYGYSGTQLVDTGLYLTGGANDGTTPLSWRLEGTANAKLIGPFESLPISIWNDTTGSRTVTVQGIWDGGAVPNNNQIWMEVEYLGTASSTQSSFASTGLADVLATPAALSAGDGTWSGSTTKFKMASTITVAEKGPITVKVYVGAASSVFFIDPRITLS